MPFGYTHLLALLISAVGIAIAYGWGWMVRRSGRTCGSACLLAAALLALEVWKTWQGFTAYEEAWRELLPLHLCRISAYLCAFVLLTRNYRSFEVAYFWGAGGSLAALLSPDLKFDFPHPMFVGFFLGHTLVLSSVLFIVAAFDFKPRLRSIGFAALVTVVYMMGVALINLALDTNYLYVCHKPEGITLYRYLGAWPWYIGSVWFIGVVLSFILYLPFAWRRRSRAAHSP